MLSVFNITAAVASNLVNKTLPIFGILVAVSSLFIIIALITNGKHFDLRWNCVVAQFKSSIAFFVPLAHSIRSVRPLACIIHKSVCKRICYIFVTWTLTKSLSSNLCLWLQHLNGKKNGLTKQKKTTMCSNRKQRLQIGKKYTCFLLGSLVGKQHADTYHNQ